MAPSPQATFSSARCANGGAALVGILGGPFRTGLRRAYRENIAGGEARAESKAGAEERNMCSCRACKGQQEHSEGGYDRAQQQALCAVFT